MFEDEDSKKIPTEPPTARGQRTRQRLFSAAEKVFGEQGYERAAIIDITQAAGVAQGTFYVYFPSKKAIFVELVEDLGSRLRHQLASAVPAQGTRLEAERAGFHAFVAFVDEHRNLYRIVRQAEFVDEELYRQYYRKMADGYREGLAKAMNQGELAKLDPEAIVYALMGIFDFLGMRWVLWEGQPPPKRVLDDVFDFIAHGLSPSRRRP